MQIFQIDDTNRLPDYISELKTSLNWNDTDQKEMCRLKQGRMAERSKPPDSRNSSVENSGTRVCAWVRFPLLSENVLNTIRQSPQPTNSVILELQFKMTVQSKRKQKTRNVIGRLIAEQFESAQKKDTRRRHAKHDSTRGFKCKSFQIDDTNRLADYISELKTSLNWNDKDQKEMCWRKPGRMAERSEASDWRNSSVKNSGTRVCAWVRIPLLSENVLNTMKQSLQLTNSVILKLQFKMTIQSERKQKTRNVIGPLIAELFKSAQKRGYRAKTCETRLNAWVSVQIFPNRWHKPFSRLHLWIENVTQLKWHRSKGNMLTWTSQDGRAVWGARLKKLLGREFWCTSVCVGSNPTPVRKRFEHDEAEPSADKFYHTGTTIQDDSPKQKQTKDSQRHWAVDSRAL